MWWVRLVQLARASSLFENHSLLLANTPSLRAVIDVTLLTDIMIFHSTYLSVWILYLGEIFHHLVLLFILICTINNYIAIIILKLTLCIIQSCIISMLYLAFKQKLICIANLTARAACGRRGLYPPWARGQSFFLQRTEELSDSMVRLNVVSCCIHR